jgi:hypothetical protein
MSHPDNDASASFAQTTVEFTLDDSDDEDLRSEIGAGANEVYEMSDRQRIGGGPSAIWDVAADEDDEDEGNTHLQPLVDRRRPSGGSAVSADSFQLYTPDEDHAVRRKFDRKLVLFVALLFMLSFLDRSSMFSFPLCPLECSIELGPADRNL